MEIFLSYFRTILIQHVKSCIVGMLVGLNVSIQRTQFSLVHHKETLLCRYYRRQSYEGTMLQLSRSVGTSIKLRLSVGTILILPCYDRTLALVGESIAAMEGNARRHNTISNEYIQNTIVEVSCHALLVYPLTHDGVSLSSGSVFYILVFQNGLTLSHLTNFISFTFQTLYKIVDRA